MLALSPSLSADSLRKSVAAGRLGSVSRLFTRVFGLSDASTPTRLSLRLTVALAVAAMGLSGCAMKRQASQPGYVAQAKQMWRRGFSALESGKVGEAESWLRRAAERTPEDGPTQRHLAEALWQQGQHDEAITCAEEACRCIPSDCEATIRAGEMHLARGDAGSASQWAGRAIDLNARSAAAWALRGRAHQKQGRTDKALADFQQALRYAPTDAQLLTDVALLHRARGEHRRCLTTLHHLLDAYPPGQEPAGALALAGESYLALGRARDAADTLQIAAARGPADAELLYRLAEAQEACGHRDRAIADARRALDIDSAHDGSRQLIARLQATGANPVR